MTSPPRNHKVIENVSLVPVNDPTILFTNSGMFPLVPYLLGETHPLGTRLTNFQRCLRTSLEEIEEIGDNRHTLMFEMMGNWSLGDYFKKEQINNVLKLYVEEFGLDVNRIFVTVFAGDDDAPRDDESIKYWQEAFAKYGVTAEFSEDIHDLPNIKNAGSTHAARIFPYPKSKNWWQRGNAVGELGGPDTEMFYDRGVAENEVSPEEEHVNSDSGRFIEIGNSVFIQYKLNESLKWEEISQKNVDFGGGFERVVMLAQNKEDIFETDLFTPIISSLEDLTGLRYKDRKAIDQTRQNSITKSFRIIADHIRGSVFILGDGVKPANKDQGYILRSLIRRMVRRARMIDLTDLFTAKIAEKVIDFYAEDYPHLIEEKATILNELEKEEVKFAKTLEKGLKELQKFTGRGISIDGKTAFFIYETYGFPIEMIIEEIKSEEINDSGDLTPEDISKIIADFNKEQESHRANSRAGAEQKFKGGLADHSKETTALHTAHHLLLAALQKVLGKHVKQRGSNITADRLRIDFSHNDKLTNDEISAVEELVNEVMRKSYVVEKQIMPKAKAEEIGAEMEFGQKYGDLVNVYFIKDPKDQSIFSAEFCGGPHVENTNELTKFGVFRILKEESNGSGVRRIKATISK
ncbi:alanine--tRNA ligase [Candidatus Dojkabacteria bacterium]|uniref:alanine--tRNA ligase n=1 Tax=Candidatus Dojkabacteria bacterium TaxID=2099670 RepID=A0A952AIC4_9BACT|nr:alanine--tRNA ligase [Candidatus Dojkabacteria bacterium]